MTHRLALWESILIKDSHLDALRKENIKDVIGTALDKAWKNRKKGIFIEIETKNEKEAIKAFEKFKELKDKENNLPCLVMFDNIKVSEVKSIIKKLKNRKLLDYALIEASGGINPDNIKGYANSGVDALSLGYLTTSQRSLDIKLRVV